MAKAKAGPISAGRLKSFIERVEKLLEERSAINGDVRDVFAEAKGVGYDTKTMRKLITVRAMDAADRAEQETLLDTYAHALGMETSANVVEPSEEDLIDRASKIVVEVDRCLDLVEDGRPPKIAAIQELIGCSLGKASKLRTMVSDRISRSNVVEREMKNENRPAVEMVEADIAQPGGLFNRMGAVLRERYGAENVNVGHGGVSVEVTLPAKEDDLAILPFLRREKATA